VTTSLLLLQEKNTTLNIFTVVYWWQAVTSEVPLELASCQSKMETQRFVHHNTNFLGTISPQGAGR
jgi:hypothetical protein